MRTLLLAIVYFLVVTPVGLIRRATGDPMRRQWEPDAKSYWIPAAPPGA